MKPRTNARITKEKIEKSANPSNKVKNNIQQSKVREKKSIETKTGSNSKPSIFHKETLQITKKTNNYIDNYQFLESRVIRNPKKKEQIFTHHIRRENTFTYQSQINQKGQENQSKFKGNTSKGRLSDTFHINFRANKPDRMKT